jgi:Glycosyl hydrolases family 35
MRTNDAMYLSFVRRWWQALLPRLVPLTAGEGGPVVMVQLENEFGYFNPTTATAYLTVWHCSNSTSRCHCNHTLWLRCAVQL